MTQLSANKEIMASEIWDPERVIHIDFLARSIEINAQYYSNLLQSDMLQAIRKRRHDEPSKIILLLDNASPHTENLTTTTLVTILTYLLTYLRS
jgi:hypothetical protein